ncbi:MAG: hypothetical protein LW884_07195 [Bacteroidetes bacterium]|jgi:DNA phosphorothioation-dependent restriction protein DptG|nr:hypothetical protein [Bacteroidota bacterium]
MIPVLVACSLSFLYACKNPKDDAQAIVDQYCNCRKLKQEDKRVCEWKLRQMIEEYEAEYRFGVEDSTTQQEIQGLIRGGVRACLSE